MEEAAFMDPLVFQKVIVPLLGVLHTAVLAISTPEDDSNYYSILLSQKGEDGKPLFKTLPVGLACEECQKEGKEADCPHNKDQLPPWKSDALQKLQKQLLPPEIYATEALGLITTKKRYAFNKKHIEETFSLPPLTVMDAVGVVYVMIDPSGNGSGKSHLAITAFTIDEKRNYVVSERVYRLVEGEGFAFITK